MNMAAFFQKHGGNFFVKIFRRFYFSCMVNSNEKRVKYFRDAGAKIGENVILRDLDCLGAEPYLVEIGNNTSFSYNVRITTHDGSVARLYYMGLTPRKFDSFGKVKIGDNCFIGMNSVIMKNVTIGDNCFIGVGAVVTKSIPPNSVAVGVPAKVIGTIDEYIAKNQENFDPTPGMSSFEKREYILGNMEKYEALRQQHEIH